MVFCMCALYILGRGLLHAPDAGRYRPVQRFGSWQSGERQDKHTRERLGFDGKSIQQRPDGHDRHVVTCAVVGGFLTRRFGPTRMLPTYMLGWASMALINAAARNFDGIVTMRFFLGMFEGCFRASVTIYFTSFYTSGELGKRMAAWYPSAAISGAFSGLLAYGVFQVNVALTGWKILFIIEGWITVVVALISIWILPDYPQRAAFLSPLDKEVAIMQ
ncbi:major facilitator superfamily domain-containing protein [Mycena galericulata]|nr:major facilitator superfamily domain-containing protein [Mycena galericulata]